LCLSYSLIQDNGNLSNCPSGYRLNQILNHAGIMVLDQADTSMLFGIDGTSGNKLLCQLGGFVLYLLRLQDPELNVRPIPFNPKGGRTCHHSP
jgi:hypothetical protein